MSNYNLTPIVSPSIEAFDAKAARKKVLDEVRKRRYQIAQTRHKHEQQTYQENEEYREYVDYSG